MTQKPKLSVGDRVRCYGNSQVGGKTHLACGKVLTLHSEGWIQVIFDEAGDWTVHEDQCRKLRPKQKPEKERERIVRFLTRSRSRGLGEYIFPDRDTAKADSPTGFEPVRMVELKPSEVVLGREELEKAIDQIPLFMSSCERHAQITEPLCKRFGLGKDKA